MIKPTPQEMYKMSAMWMVKTGLNVPDEEIAAYFAEHGWDWKKEFQPLLGDGTINIRDIGITLEDLPK